MLATDGDPRRASDDGTLDATYGDVRLRCNLGDVPRTVAGAQLPAYGFRADAPGLTAGLAPDGTGYVTQRTDDRSELWLYGFPGAAVAIPVPFPNGVDLALDGTPAMRLKVADGALRLTLPQRGSPVRIQPPAERAARAPRDWPGAKPVIAVIDLGAGVSPALTSVTHAAWRAALEASDLIRKHGLTLRVLATYDELAAALAAGPERTFAIVNPYGEIFLSPGPDRWRETLDAVRAYVNHGGIWWNAAYSFHRAAVGERPGGLNSPVLPVSPPAPADHGGRGRPTTGAAARDRNRERLARPRTRRTRRQEREFGQSQRTLRAGCTGHRAGGRHRRRVYRRLPAGGLGHALARGRIQSRSRADARCRSRRARTPIHHAPRTAAATRHPLPLSSER